MHLQLLPMLVTTARIDEALKGLTSDPNRQLNRLLSRDVFKEDRILGRLDSKGDLSPAKALSSLVADLS
jgi:hypothetical protein